MKNSVRHFQLFLGLVLLLALGSLNQISAQDDEGTKGIQPEEAGVKNRPLRKFVQSGSSPKRRQTEKAPKKFTYKTAKKYSPPKPVSGQEVAQVGVTFWRFRPTTSADATKELIDEGPDKPAKEWTLERLETDAPVKIGERLRIGLESLSRTGYLYVVDRELYTDGTMGTPRLIFPTTRIRGGNNFVKPGNLLYLPPAPRFFRIQQSRPEKTLVSEVLTVIISSQPLDLPEEIGERAMTLPESLIAKWETEWKTNVLQMDLENGKGEALTPQEKQAGDEKSKDLIDTDDRLTQDDPPPQTVFQSVVKTINPFLVKVSIRYGK